MNFCIRLGAIFDKANIPIMASKDKLKKQNKKDDVEDKEETKKTITNSNGQKPTTKPKLPTNRTSTKKDKDEDISSSDEDEFVNKKELAKKPVLKKKPAQKKKQDDSSSSSEEEKIEQKKSAKRAPPKPKKPAAAGNTKNTKVETKKQTEEHSSSSSSSDSEDEKPKNMKKPQKNKPKTNKKTKEEEEKSDDEDIDEDRLNLISNILSGDSKGILPDNIEDMKMPDISKLIPKKKLATDLDNAMNEMLENNDFSIDRLVEIAMENGGIQSEQKRILMREQLNKALGGLNPLTQTCTYLRKVILLGIRYAKPTKDCEGVGYEEEMKEYKSILDKTLNNRSEETRMKFSKIHMRSVSDLFTAYRTQIRNATDHKWIIDELQNNESGIQLTYGRDNRAIIPLSKIYICITNLDIIHEKRRKQNKKETPEQKKFREQVENDAGELEHHLWKLFSLVAPDSNERGDYEDRAYELIRDENDTRAKLTQKGRSLQDAYRDKMDMYDENGKFMPGALLGSVLADINTQKKDDEAIRSVVRDINRGTFDIGATLNAIKRDAEKAEQEQEEREKKEEEEKKNNKKKDIDEDG